MNSSSCPPHNGSGTRRRWLLALCAAGALFLFWSQTIHVPYWQDDYHFLVDVRQAIHEGRSWLAPFFPAAKLPFWRPLGMETYWRFVVTFLGADVVYAHIANIVLLVAAAAAVGWFAATLVTLLAPDRKPVPAAVAAGFLYGIHASHFLPAAWVAAANDSIAVLFSALALRFWLIVATSRGKRLLPAAAATAVCLALALLSRDSSFVLPPLGFLLVLWLRPRFRPSPAAVGVGALCTGIALAWLAARNHFTMTVDPAYTITFGANVVRNAGCLLLFSLNVPFESLRYFFFVKASAAMAAWGIVSFALQAAALGILLRGTRQRLGERGWLALALFFVIGCAPYYLLSFNCYPYYTSIALFAYAVVAGFAAPRTQAVVAASVLALFSSALATGGNYLLDSPSHIGRARWTERQLQKMAALREAQPGLFSAPLYLVVEDTHKFLGFGTKGIAYRLGMDTKQVRIVEPGDPEAGKRPVLVVPKEGDIYFRPGSADYAAPKMVTGDGGTGPDS